MSIRNRVISFLLVLCMTLGMLPVISVGSNINVEATPVVTQKDGPQVYVYENESLKSQGMQQVVDGSTAHFQMSLWHYSGGYWAASDKDPNRVYDNEFRKSQGGVANAEDTFASKGLSYGVKDFEYIVQAGSDLAKSLEAGDDIYVEIDKDSPNDDVSLSKLFNLPTSKDSLDNTVFTKNENGSLKGYDSNGKIIDTLATVKKLSNGNWVITFKLPIKMNIYEEGEFSFEKFGLGLTKYIPIPKLGFGWIMFSMFPRNKGTIQNNGNLPSYFWFADETKGGKDENGVEIKDYLNWNNYLTYENKEGKTSIYDNRIHPNMIKKYSNGLLMPGYQIKLLRGDGIVVDSNDYKIGIGTLNNAGAVGMFFDYSLKLNIYAKPKTKVIASYVEVVDVTADGKPIFKQVRDSEELKDVTVVNGVAELDERRIVDVKGDTWVGSLNDVIASPKDLGEADTVKWEDSVTPASQQDKIQLNSNDIDYYKFGIITQDEEGNYLLQNTFDKGSNSAESGSGNIMYKIDYVTLMNILSSHGVSSIAQYNLLPSQLRNAIYMQLIQKATPFVNYSNVPRSVTPPVPNTNEKKAQELLNPLQVPVIPKDEGSQKSTDESYDISNKKSENIQNDTYTVENKKGTTTDSGIIGDTDIKKENIIYVRYIAMPDIVQRNRVHIIYDGEEIEINEIEKLVSYENDMGSNADVSFVNITKELAELWDTEESNVTINKWITSSENIEDLVKNPIPSTGTQWGEDIPGVIPNVPKTEDIYADWTVEINPPDKKIQDEVPQWRLSKFVSQYEEWRKARMWLSLSSDAGHATSYITPSGTYNYSPVNPNELIADNNNTPENQRDTATKWIHSKALTRGNYFISHDSSVVSVEMNGTRTLIKTTEDSGLTSAKWVENKATTDGLIKYDVLNGTLPNKYSGGETYHKTGILDYGLHNDDIYTHYKGIYYHYYCGGDDCSGHCGCYVSPEIAGPNYLDAKYDNRVTYERYKQQNTDSKKLVVQPEVKNESGITSIKYQLNNTLNIYPEYGMLFANDAGKESIKWVVGDQARKISPVVYQTLQHKVYVVPNSNGTSYATDSRAITQANSLGEGKKQVIYKGAGVNTAFQLYRDSEKKNKALLTVKTYALDFRNDESYKDVKSSWGNTDYNSYKEHQNLLNSINTKKTADATEKLLVDSSPFGSLDYTGAIKSLKTGSYNLVKYSMDNKVDGGNAVVFEHRLLVRGGAVIGVVPANRSNGKAEGTPISMEQLKTQDLSLYNALLNMNLYNESIDRSKTVFSTFEHLTGDALTEGSYATMLEGARKEADSEFTTPASSAVSEGKGWYSEDTTVLVVKEYVSNYEVPSISFGDKLSMSVKGLETPIDKGQFFKTMGKGHTYLRYDLKLGTKLGAYSLPNEIDSYFEYTSFGNDSVKGNLNKDYFEDKEIVFGEQKVDYLVPNVSVSDTTRLS